MKVSTGPLCTYSTRSVKTTVVVLRIYGARAIFLLFFDHQETESKSCELEISVAGPIFTHKNIKVSMGQRYPYAAI